MTETEWWASKKIRPMLEHLQAHGSERKLLLLLVGGIRRFWAFAHRDVQRAALLVEQYIEGTVSLEKLQVVNPSLQTLHLCEGSETTANGVAFALHNCTIDFAWDKAQQEFDAHGKVEEHFLDEIEDASNLIWWGEVKAHTRLLHDIFGPLPFRDVAIASEWITSDVAALARGIYDHKAFDRMPILADALQDAGCDNDELLNHCRDEKCEHVRGCWVLDLLLGKPWRASP